MRFKASNHLPVILFIFACANFAQALPLTDFGLTESLQKKDWPSIVLLLQPLQGQNFEHDLVLAKALLSLERRQEAQKLLGEMMLTRKDERVSKLLQTAATLFFSQETSNLYYEGIEFIHDQKFPEAREKFEQGLSKEPGQILLLTRLIQVELVLNKIEAAKTNLKVVESSSLSEPILKLYAAKIATTAEVDEENLDELFLKFLPLKQALLENEVTLTFWAEVLKRSQKTLELQTLAQKILKEHPTWTYALLWLFQNGKWDMVTHQKLLAQIDKNLKSRDLFLKTLDADLKKSDYFWVGYANYEQMLAQWKKIGPTIFNGAKSL